MTLVSEEIAGPKLTLCDGRDMSDDASKLGENLPPVLAQPMRAPRPKSRRIHPTRRRRLSPPDGRDRSLGGGRTGRGWPGVGE